MTAQLIRVFLEIRPPLSEGLGKSNMSLQLEEGAVFEELLQKLATKSPRLGDRILDAQNRRIRGDIVVVVNDRLLDLAGGMSTKLEEGDKVVFLPAYQGG